MEATALVFCLSFHEPGRADLLVSLDAPQRVPTRFMVPLRDSGIVEASHEAGRADLLVGLDAPQRVPTGFMAPVRDLGIKEATLERQGGPASA